MQGKESARITICTDCLVLLANGDVTPGADMPPLGKIDYAAGDELTVGMLAEFHSCGREDGADVDECDCEQAGFRNDSCDGCGSGLAGDRYYATLWFTPFDRATTDATRYRIK